MAIVSRWLTKERPGDDTPVSMDYAAKCGRRMRARTREIIHALGALRYMDTHQIRRIFFGGADTDNTCWTVLKTLRDKRMIYYRKQGFDVAFAGDTRLPNIWYLDWNGAYLYRQLWPTEPLWWDEHHIGQDRTMKHTVLGSEIWSWACAAAADARTSLARVAWLGERPLAFPAGAADQKAEWFKPDALLALRFASGPSKVAQPYDVIERFAEVYDCPLCRAAEAVGVTEQGWGCRACGQAMPEEWDRRRPQYRLAPSDEWHTRYMWIEVDTGQQRPRVHERKARIYKRALVESPGTWQRLVGKSGFGPVLIVTKGTAILRGPGERLSRVQSLLKGWSSFALQPDEYQDYEKLALKRPVAIATWNDLATHGLLGPIWWLPKRSAPVELLELFNVG